MVKKKTIYMYRFVYGNPSSANILFKFRTLCTRFGRDSWNSRPIKWTDRSVLKNPIYIAHLYYRVAPNVPEIVCFFGRPIEPETEYFIHNIYRYSSQCILLYCTIIYYYYYNMPSSQLTVRNGIGSRGPLETANFKTNTKCNIISLLFFFFYIRKMTLDDYYVRLICRPMTMTKTTTIIMIVIIIIIIMIFTIFQNACIAKTIT